MAIIGIDNGTSGTIGFICGSGYEFYETPVKKTIDFTSSKTKNIHRLDIEEFSNLLKSFVEKAKKEEESLICYMERPLINPALFQASLIAVRCFEAQITILEDLKISYTVFDSKAWQRKLLPKTNFKDKKLQRKALKENSKQVAIRLFPKCKDLIERHKDGDGLLIARCGFLIEGGECKK